MSRSRAVAFVLLMVIGSTWRGSTSWGQSHSGRPWTLRPHSKSLSQRATTIHGRAFHHSRQYLAPHTPVRVEVTGLKAEDHPTEDQFSAIVVRMRQLQKVVDAALQPVQGQPPTTDHVIKQLQTSLAGASGELKTDLNSMLIASLNGIRRSGTDVNNQPYDDATWVWSYRRLDRHESWGPVIETSPNSVLMIPVLNLFEKAELQARTVPDFPIVDPVRSGSDPDTILDVPGGFDVINLHVHGLNVSPNWPGDNIFRQIFPRQLKFYFFQIPGDHPAGTFFYHPHKHGSVATQVAGGMAGALIVRNPSTGLDQLDEKLGWGQSTESILMFQQLTLYKRDANSTERFTRPDFFALKDVDITLGQLCTERPDIQKIAQRLAGNVTPPRPPVVRLPDIETWVSGQFQPCVNAVPAAFGEIRRFRLIHAGVEETINFTLQPMQPGAPPAILQVIAWDGIPLKRPYFITEQQQLTLAPGNRADVLVSVPTVPGITFPSVIDYAVVQRGSDPIPENVLAVLAVDPKKKLASVPGFVSDEDAAAIYQSCAPRLHAPDVPNLEAINISFADAVIDAAGKFTPGTFQINRSPFALDQKFFRVHHSQNLALNVAGGDTSHPLHIHVNQMFIPADPNRGSRGQPTCEYWSDTVLLQPNEPLNVTMPFNHWTGDAVLHCHILDHEDAGMMSQIHIRPDVLSWPEFPLGKIMDLTRIPQDTLDNLKVVWPKAGTLVTGNTPNSITVFFFMPPGAQGNACPHCSESVQALARFRKSLSNTGAVRVVAISATDGSALPNPAALGLLPEYDLLCSDPEMRSFESIGLIDATPHLSPEGELRFPQAFVPNNRQLIWPGDLMHGLFIVDANGMVVSTRRAFSAFDDTAQIMREVQMATLGHDAIRAAFDRAIALRSSSFGRRRLEVDRKRFEQRIKQFESTKLQSTDE
jgi:FtsP/CotA-like multicopper oxidase with cupredoxin domain